MLACQIVLLCQVCVAYPTTYSPHTQTSHRITPHSHDTTSPSQLISLIDMNTLYSWGGCDRTSVGRDGCRQFAYPMSTPSPVFDFSPGGFHSLLISSTCVCCVCPAYVWCLRMFTCKLVFSCVLCVCI